MKIRAFIQELEKLARVHGDDVEVHAYDEDGLAEAVAMPVYEHAWLRVFIEVDPGAR